VKSFEGVDVAKILSIQEMPVQSVITAPLDGAAVSDAVADDASGTKAVALQGWAWSGGGRGIARVDVSADGGETWVTATLEEGAAQHPSRAWAWTFWSAEVPVPATSDRDVALCCRATDASYNVQPPEAAPFWNKRGLNNNAWHRVKLKGAE